jgi:hypothetical protein
VEKNIFFFFTLSFTFRERGEEREEGGEKGEEERERRERGEREGEIKKIFYRGGKKK